MSFKKMLFVLTITISVIFIGLWGTSYAYYLSSEGTTINATTGDFDTSVTVIFNQSEYINTVTGTPISAFRVNTEASKTTFELVPDSTLLSGYTVAIKISLVDFLIAEELRVKDFKYDLICNDGDTTQTVAKGTGRDITDEMVSSQKMPFGTLTTIDINKTYTCNFRVWLEETGTNQSSLMNKKFSGRIRINTAIKK